MIDTAPIAVTMGDPAGVGPEVVVKALSRWQETSAVVIGDAARLRKAAEICGLDTAIVPVGAPDAAAEADGIACLDLANVPADLPFGTLAAAGGKTAYSYVVRAAELALAGKVRAICTAPLNKAALHAAGHIYPGHTELLAELCGVPEVSMMLTAPGLRVIHVTTHIGLIDAIARIDDALVYRTVKRGAKLLARAGLLDPRIGVCGINPHAGEGGLFGHGEEDAKIAPAIRRLQAEGIRAEGPLPADTLFFLAKRGDCDLVVAMYHDQGHGPIKVLGLEDGVNITVGLPVVRTSVDHGTAFDIAGKGIADSRSLTEALKQAAQLSGLAR